MCFGQIRKGRQHCPNWRSKRWQCLVRTKQEDQLWYFWNLLGTCNWQRNLFIIEHWLFWQEYGARFCWHGKSQNEGNQSMCLPCRSRFSWKVTWCDWRGFCTHALWMYLSPGYHCWWRCKSFMLLQVRKTAEQLLQHVDLPILDRKDGTDYGQIFQGCLTEQQGL